MSDLPVVEASSSTRPTPSALVRGGLRVDRIRTTRLESWEALPDLEQEWADLLHRSPSHSVFQTFPWHVCWWRAFGGPHKLLVILGYLDSRLVGIAPMMVTREDGLLGRIRKRVCFIGSTNGASDYCDFIIDPGVPEALDALLDEIGKHSRPADRLYLSHFPSRSANHARVLECFASRGVKTTVEVEDEAPVRIMGDAKEDLKVANKSKLKGYANYFKKTGNLQFYRCKSEDEVMGYLDSFFEQHKARWTQLGPASQFLDPAQQTFYRDLVRNFVPHGWLRFDVVVFNGTPLAFHFGFEYRNRLIYYKPTFDVEFASRSPGAVLLKYLLEDAIERNLEEFDFTVGSEPYKYRYANKIRFNHRLIVFNSIGDYWIYRCLSRSKRMLKSILGRK